MKEGTGLIECDGKSYVVEPGDMILFHPEAVHSIYTATNVPLKYSVLKFDVNKLYTENSYAPKIRAILSSARKNEAASIYFKEEEIEDIGRSLYGLRLAALDGGDVYHRVERHLGSLCQIHRLERRSVHSCHTCPLHRTERIFERVFRTPVFSF